MLYGRLENCRHGISRHALGVRINDELRTIDRNLRALVGKALRAARIHRQNIVLAGLDVPRSDHLDQFRAIRIGDVVVLREVLL